MPKVSVIVPCYNSENYIHRCIDSLVYQTFEDIEILIIDNRSTDKTWKIAKEYERNFPDKIRALKLGTHFDGPGAGRNLGLKYARADYIGFADSDDYFEYDAFEKMYKKAIEEKCDLVYTASYDVKESECKMTRQLPTGSREEMLTIGSMVFWNKLIHKSLFKTVGMIPEDIVFEDLAYCPGLVSYAGKIGYIDEPLYYYIIREDSGVNTMDPERVLQSVKAENIAISLCKPEYREYLTDSIAMRNCNNIRDRWQFTDKYIEQLFDLKPYLEHNSYFQNDERNRPRVYKYYNFVTGEIPRIIYVNNFGECVTEEYIESLKSNAFWNGCKLVLLDETTCDPEDNNVKECINNGDYQKAAQYFGLKNICETGGIYIDSIVELENPMNFLLHLRVFFAYIDKKNFSGRIFGAQSGNDVIKSVFEKYKAAIINCDKGLPDVIKEVLRIDYGMKLNGQSDIYNETASVFAPEVFVVNKEKASLHIANHNFKRYAEEKGYLTMKQTSMN